MSWILGFAGAFAIIGAFDDAQGDTFTQRQEWQLGIGILLIVLAVIVYVWRDHDEE